jgi:AraC-like DNA-binding protein
MRAGFGSLRRFNSVFVEVYGRPPTKIRRTRGAARHREGSYPQENEKRAPAAGGCR